MSDIASTYQRLFKRNGATAPGGPPKLDAQVMAVVLASYATKESLAGLIYDPTSASGFQFSDANDDGSFNLSDGDVASLDGDLISAVEAYGFEVTVGGLGSSTFNAGDSGEAFGVDDNSELKVIDLLLATDAMSHEGLLYDLDQGGQIDEEEETLRVLADDVFSQINDSGSA